MPPKAKIIADEDIKKNEEMNKLVMEEIKVKYFIIIKILYI